MHVSIHHSFTDNVNQQGCIVSGSLVIAKYARTRSRWCLWPGKRGSVFCIVLKAEGGRVKMRDDVAQGTGLRRPLTTIKIMHIYMINLAKLSFPVSFILHWLALTRAATRCAISDHRMSPDKITSYSFLFREARSDDNFVSGLFISPSPSSCWLGGQKLLRNVWGSIRYVIICYLNTIYAAEGKSNGCVCPTLYR